MMTNGNNEDKVAEIGRTLEDVRKIMSLSTHSHISGYIPLLCGVSALLGSLAAHRYPEHMLLEAIIVLVAAIAVLFIFTLIEARKNGVPLAFSKRNRRMFVGLALPMSVGGILCIAMLMAGVYDWLVPVMLLCTGLGAVNLSQNTDRTIMWAGIGFILTGVAACFLRQYAMFIWTLGFGWLDLLYGIILLLKNRDGGKK